MMDEGCGVDKATGCIARTRRRRGSWSAKRVSQICTCSIVSDTQSCTLCQRANVCLAHGMERGAVRTPWWCIDDMSRRKAVGTVSENLGAQDVQETKHTMALSHPQLRTTTRLPSGFLEARGIDQRLQTVNRALRSASQAYQTVAEVYKPYTSKKALVYNSSESKKHV